MGYVIGLGDRHGSNILVDQLTWGALHIDFGDVSKSSHTHCGPVADVASAIWGSGGTLISPGEGSVAPHTDDDQRI